MYTLERRRRKLAKLQFLDLDDATLKEIAITDSPSFKGSPKTVNPIDDKQIINYRYIKRMVKKAIDAFKIENAESKTNVLTGLVPGADYLINMYGINTINVDPNFPFDVIWTDTYPEDYVFVSHYKAIDKVFVYAPDEEPLPKGYVKVGYFALVNTKGEVLAKSDHKIQPIDWPNDNSSFPQSVSLRVTAPIDGFIYGYLNYGMGFAVPIPVKYMSAIRLNDEKIDTYKASIVQQNNQTIIVSVDGVEYKDNFTAEPGTPFTAYSQGYPGYKGGAVHPSSGVFDDNKIFTAEAATTTTYKFTIKKLEHQQITVRYNNTDYTITGNQDRIISGVPLNTVLTARVSQVDYGYTAGKISPSNTIKVKDDVTITASDVVPIPYQVTITQQENEIIHVSNASKTYTASFSANYRSIIKVTVSSLASDDWLPGDVLISGSYQNTEVPNEFIVLGPVNVTAVAARENDFSITLPATNNQTIELTYTNPKRSAVVITSNKRNVTTAKVKYGATWNATVLPASGYTAGTMNVTHGTITDNVNITITDAEPINEGS